MGKLPFLIFTILIYIFIDIYTWYGMKSLFVSERYLKIFNFTYWALAIFGLYAAWTVYQHQITHGSTRDELLNFYMGFVFALVVSKLVFATTMILHDGGRMVFGLFHYLKSILIHSEQLQFASVMPARWKMWTTSATIIAGIPFITLLYGVTKGKYQYSVEKVKLEFNHLPSSFDGLRIVQISDIHAGSFDNIEKVRAGIEKINKLKPDIVLFTGDLVNAEKDEIDPYISLFSEIKATYGKFAVLGNHDYYGTYSREKQSATEAYWNDFFKKYEAMGFQLLNNTHQKIYIGNEYINIVGVENWGGGKWFPKYGDLEKATAGLTSDDFNILMSHDPTHWDEKVLKHPIKMDITLSGHTHGFQFGVNLPGIKWSPAMYRYPRWMGLYKEKDSYLYVNRGFGFLGYPGRVGMLPEITLIELQRAEPQ